jgi:hypothetical protein
VFRKIENIIHGSKGQLPIAYWGGGTPLKNVAHGLMRTENGDAGLSAIPVRKMTNLHALAA